MGWLIFVYLFYFLPSVIVGVHQKWQNVTRRQLEMLLNGTEGEIRPDPFWEAANISEILGLCEEMTQSIPQDGRTYNSSLAVSECQAFFIHRERVQKWMDELFALIPKCGLSVELSALLKSWFWAMDNTAYNSISEAFTCWQLKKYQYPFPVMTWKKFDKAFNQVQDTWPTAEGLIGITTQFIWSQDAERRKRMKSYGFPDISAICEPKRIK